MIARLRVTVSSYILAFSYMLRDLFVHWIHT